MKISKAWIGWVAGAIASLIPPLLSSPAQAASVELQVYKSIDAQTVGSACPARVTLNETSQPYREGGYTIDGSASLGWLADNFVIANSDDFSVTWVGKLKPQYTRCKATAGVVRHQDGGSYLSYLRMRFVGGKVYLLLDMTGTRDANELTPAILKKGVRNGNPFWSWGGTD